MGRILVVGGYGSFGSRAAERLAREADLEIIVAGRSLERARQDAERLAKSAKARITPAAIDAMKLTPAQLQALAPDVVINASGPFQSQDYSLALACIAARCHYVDLADARAFVTGITALDAEAKAAGVAVIAGASTVPGLSSAVVRQFAQSFARLDTLDIGISPGSRFDPGLATTQSILGAAGHPIAIREAGMRKTAYGWQGLHRHAFPGIGRRWMGHVDVPDLDLFPRHYPTLQTARVWGGLEAGLFHLGIWSLSGLVRAGLVASLAPLSRPLLAIKRRLGVFGTDRGAMFVTMTGADANGAPHRIDWHLVAERGHGPYIPTIASVLLARKLARREFALRGAMACFEFFTLEEFLREVRDLEIRASFITA